MKIKIQIELEFDEELWGIQNEQEKEWFYNDILKGPNLALFDYDIGDEVGTVKVINIEEE